MYYKCHKINPNRGESYVDFPDWIKQNYLQRITKIKPFINKYHWEKIDFPSDKGDWNKFEKSNRTISGNVLYGKKEKIYHAYVSKCNSNGEKQVILLMIWNGEGWYYLAMKKLSALLRGVTSKNDENLYCSNCLYSCRTKNKCEFRKKVCENKDFL